MNHKNRLLVQEILHRLELKETVSVEELIYLHDQSRVYPEVERWVNKLIDFYKESYENTVEDINLCG